MERLSIRNAFMAFAIFATALELAVMVLTGGLAHVGAGDIMPLVELAATAIVMVSVAFALGRHFARRTETLVGGLHRLAKGDLTCKLNLTGRDDFAWLGYEYDSARKSLTKLVRELLELSQRVSDCSEQLRTDSTTISGSSQQQSEAASTIAAAIEEMAVSVSHVADNARQARDFTDEAGAATQKGRTVIGGVVGEVGNIAEAVHSSSAVIEELGRKSAEIRSIVSVIDELADQTNLLALNAAIEAARAGEQGRGFAVVADEVRKLAERTASATREIGDMIAAVDSGSEHAVKSMHGGVAKVERGVELAREAGQTIDEINSQTMKVVSAVGDITVAMEEQRSATDQIARHVEEIARMAERNSEGTVRTRETAETLTGLSGQLKEAAGRFTV